MLPRFMLLPLNPSAAFQRDDSPIVNITNFFFKQRYDAFLSTMEGHEELNNDDTNDTSLIKNLTKSSRIIFIHELPLFVHRISLTNCLCRGN